MPDDTDTNATHTEDQDGPTITGEDSETTENESATAEEDSATAVDDSASMGSTDTTSRTPDRDEDAATSSGTDDRILTVTRWSAYVIFPIFVLTALALLVAPGRTETYFSWAISPELTPLLMGAGYGAGTYYFYRIATVEEWHRVHVLLIPGTIFAWGLTLATILHWEAFIPNHLPTYAWVAIYVVVPFLLPGLWVYNRRTDPGFAEDAVTIPSPIRWTVAIGGAFLSGMLLYLYASPELLIGADPWALSPLTARTLLSWALLFGLFCITFGFERRWTAFKIPIETMLVWGVLALLAFPRSWGDVDQSNPLLWAILAGILGVLVGLSALYGWMERE